MNENKSKFPRFLFCFLLILPYCLISAQITVTGDAKVFIDTGAFIYSEKGYFSDVPANPRHVAKNSSKKKPGKIARNNKAKPGKSAQSSQFSNPAADCNFNVNPSESALIFSGKNKYISGTIQTNSKPKLIGKSQYYQFSFYPDIQNKKIIDCYDLNYTQKALKFSFFIRPPPQSVLSACI